MKVWATRNGGFRYRICNVQFYIFCFLSSSIMLSKVTTLFDALDKEGQIQDYQALINQEENTEMSPIIVTN